jgi:hypothetical protein
MAAHLNNNTPLNPSPSIPSFPKEEEKINPIIKRQNSGIFDKQEDEAHSESTISIPNSPKQIKPLDH